jgi:hypothetical protein
MTPTMMPPPEVVERHNKVWWSLHSPDKPFHAQLTLGLAPVWPPMREVDGKQVPERAEPFIHCPLPESGVEFWGFGTRGERDRFVSLNAALGATNLG